MALTRSSPYPGPWYRATHASRTGPENELPLLQSNNERNRKLWFMTFPARLLSEQFTLARPRTPVQLDRCGGLLIYAVCSTEPAEGLEQAERFLRAHPEFTAEPPALEEIRLPLWRGYLRTLPGKEGFDGFFAARFRRLG